MDALIDTTAKYEEGWLLFMFARSSRLGNLQTAQLPWFFPPSLEDTIPKPPVNVHPSAKHSYAPASPRDSPAIRLKRGYFRLGPSQ